MVWVEVEHHHWALLAGWTPNSAATVVDEESGGPCFEGVSSSISPGCPLHDHLDWPSLRWVLRT
jgi:hypothetical protein